jgi:hypothetical protein
VVALVLACNRCTCNDGLDLPEEATDLAGVDQAARRDLASPPDLARRDSCASADDCDGVFTGLALCAGPGGWSCGAGFCAADCEGPRTCEQARSDCLVCDDGPGCLDPTGCGVLTAMAQAFVEQGCSPAVKELTAEASGCFLILRQPDGTIYAVLELVSGQGWLGWLGSFRDVPGFCLGTYLPTGATRVRFDCQSCAVQLRF